MWNGVYSQNASLGNGSQVVSMGDDVTSGECKADCVVKTVLFIVGVFFFIYLIFVMKIPGIIVTIRYVEWKSQVRYMRHV